MAAKDANFGREQDFLYNPKAPKVFVIKKKPQIFNVIGDQVSLGNGGLRWIAAEPCYHKVQF
jgi:hypothetical protein